MAAFANLDSAEDQLHEGDVACTFVTQLMAEARDALIVTRRMMPNADVPLGSSKLGGARDLPAGVGRPTGAAGTPFSDLLEKATSPVFRSVGAMAIFMFRTGPVRCHPAPRGRSGPPAGRPDPMPLTATSR